MSRTRPTTKTEVTALYPSGSVLPENQLKLYVHFSSAMDPRTPYDHLHLVDADTGEELDAVFHALRSGLWDVSGTRLTVVFDPGRIKRGLANHEAWGPPIARGRRYRLVVDADWPTATGGTLARGFEKAFSVSAADRTRPDPDRWEITSPPRASRSPLSVTFDEPLDRRVLEGALRVRGPRGTVSGRAAIPNGETEWRFAPDAPWQAGDYTLVIECRVEDLAGNNLTRLFDVDLALDEPGESDAGKTGECPSELAFRVDS